MRSEFVGRWLLTDEGAVEGFLRLENDEVAEIGLGFAPADSVRALVLPAFVNAHTHIGDSLAYPAPKGSLEETVAPPSGYKHRILRSASRAAKIDAMRESLVLMSHTGTSAFIDFREEGLEGVRALSEASVPESPRPVVLGRPASPDTTADEIGVLLDECDGIAMSSIRDWSFAFLSELSRRAKSAGKAFSVHVSEAVHEDFDRVLDLKPDFVVHMNQAADDDLKACADAGIPVVVCPRSNEFFGIEQDIPRLLRAGLAVALGTDNGMIARPDMFEEIKAAFRSAKSKGSISALEAVSLATFGGRKVLNAAAKITQEIGAKSDFVAVRVGGDDPLMEMVTKASSRDIVAVIRGGKVRRSGDWTT